MKLPMRIHYCVYIALIFHFVVPRFNCFNSFGRTNHRASFSRACAKTNEHEERKRGMVSTVEHVRNRVGEAAKWGSCLAALYSSQISLAPAAAITSSLQVPTKGFQTKSGLKYFDAIVGTGVKPKYGINVYKIECWSISNY